MRRAAWAGDFSTLRQALAADALDDVRRVTAVRHPITGCPMSSSSVVPDPQRIVCVGINYRSHAEDRRDIFAGAERVSTPRRYASWPRRRTGAPERFRTS